MVENKVSILFIRKKFIEFFEKYNFEKKDNLLIKKSEIGYQVFEILKSSYGQQFTAHFGIFFNNFRWNSDGIFGVQNCNIYFDFVQFLTNDKGKRNHFYSNLMDYENKSQAEVTKNLEEVCDEIIKSKVLEISDLISTYSGFILAFEEMGYAKFFMTFHTRYFRPEEYIEFCKKHIQ